MSGEVIVHAYDVTTGKELFPPTAHTAGLTAVAWSPDSRLLASAGILDHSIVVWDAADGKKLHRLPALEAVPTTQLQFAADGKTLLSFASDRTLRVWDITSGHELRSFMVSPVPVYTVTLSRDGKLAVVSPTDHKVRVWDVDEGKEVLQMQFKPPANPGGFAVSCAFAPDDRTLLTISSSERVIRRWHALTGKALGETDGTSRFPTPTSSVDGRSLLGSARDDTQLVETLSLRVRQNFAAPVTPPASGARRRDTAAALSPDGHTLATTWNDGTLHFWDTGSGKELSVRKGLPPNSHRLSFSPDGKTLASFGVEATVTLWNVPAPTAEGRLVVKGVTPDKFDDLWKDVSGADAARAWQAILALESMPKEAVPFVRKHLRGGTVLDEKAVASLIAQLDADDFQEREKATETLISAGKVAEDPLKKALTDNPSAETKRRLEVIQSKRNGKQGPEPDELRVVRGVEVLERIGTLEARKALEEFAGNAESLLSAEARAALGRMKTKSAVP